MLKHSLVLILLVALAAAAGVDAPPPFGTVVSQCTLQLSGPYAGTAITWRPDSGRLYVIDQYTGTPACYSLMPENPTGTLRNENWQFHDLGGATTDLVRGIVWDSDSNCFWVSQLQDQSTSACYLMRMSEAGVWTGDSWLVSNGDIMNIAGMEKSTDQAVFCGAGTWSDQPGICRFDPYLKAVFGRVVRMYPYGCAIVPADSNYILTSDGSDFVKFNFSGGQLQTAPVTVTPDDMTVMVPDIAGPDDTVFMWVISGQSVNILQKVSTGMSWGQLLAGNRHNARPMAILSPVGVVDSGSVLTPQLVVRNCGNEVADLVRVWFTIELGGYPEYRDSFDLVNLQPHTTDTVPFRNWIPLARDSMSSIAHIYWAGDSIHRDDTLRNRFLCRVRDVAISDVFTPADTLDSGAVANIRARAWNHGNVPESFGVDFAIARHRVTRPVSLIPGGASVVPTDWVTEPGNYYAVATAILPEDPYQWNNTARGAIYVRGTITHDVGVAAIIAPVGSYDTGATVQPEAWVKNWRAAPEQCMAWFRITDLHDSVLRFDSAQVTLPANDSVAVQFGTPIQFAVPGYYTSTCSTYLATEQNNLNDFICDTFSVGMPGVATKPVIVTLRGFTIAPNPLRSGFAVLRPSQLATRNSSLDVSVYDASGRLVLNSSPVTRNSSLALDLRSMRAGVYMVRLSANGATATQKLVIQR